MQMRIQLSENWVEWTEGCEKRETEENFRSEKLLFLLQFFKTQFEY